MNFSVVFQGDRGGGTKKGAVCLEIQLLFSASPALLQKAISSVCSSV